jgi:hypothetical protein
MSAMTRNTEIWAIFRHRGLIALAAFGLAVSQVAGAQRPSGADAGSALLSAILKSAASDAGRSDLQVDPRPLIADRAVYGLEANDIARVSPTVLRQRIAAIKAAGFIPVDTIIVNKASQCLGTLVLSPVDSGRTADDRESVGCPETPLSVVAVGPPRRGAATLPPDQIYERETERAARGYWSARVVRKTMGHGRATTYAADYVLTRRGGTWAVTKIVGLMYTD